MMEKIIIVKVIIIVIITMLIIMVIKKEQYRKLKLTSLSLPINHKIIIEKCVIFFFVLTIENNMSVMLGCTVKPIAAAVDLRSMAEPFPSARTGSVHDVVLVSVVVGEVILSTFLCGGIMDGFLSDFGIGTFNEIRRSVSTSVNRTTHISMTTSSIAESVFLFSEVAIMNEEETKYHQKN